MGRINVGRVILGGLLAGLVINIGEFILNTYVLAQATQDALAKLNLPPIGGGTIGVFVIFTFLSGIVTVWLYAGIRPRFGPGVRTAVIAGLAVWYFGSLGPALVFVVLGIFPVGPSVVGTVWGLVELVIATVAGAWLYQE